MLINEYLKSWDFREYYELEVKGTPGVIYPIMLNTNFSSSFVVKLMLRLRGIGNHQGRIKEMDKLGFIRLDEIINEELLFGIITGSSTFSNCNPNISPQQFKSHTSPGIIKAVINFRTTYTGENQTLISTETRVLCADKTMRNKFRVYWLFIARFSKLIRTILLKEVKKQCEGFKK